VFDVPDASRHAEMALPARTDVQLAAIAHEITVWASEAAYLASKHVWAPESFVPSGLFEPGGPAIDPPLAQAIFTGRVLESHRPTNPLTRLPFYRLRVRTLEAQLVVAVDVTLLGAEPPVGAIVSGTFWLSGRLD
jgi:hypothetical protein